MICNAGEAFSLRSILILGKCTGLGPAAICPPHSAITGLVVFDIWQAVDILLPDGAFLGFRVFIYGVIHMLILSLQPITDVFDWLHSAWERAATQRRVALCILWVYLLALLGV